MLLTDLRQLRARPGTVVFRSSVKLSRGSVWFSSSSVQKRCCSHLHVLKVKLMETGVDRESSAWSCWRCSALRTCFVVTKVVRKKEKDSCSESRSLNGSGFSGESELILLWPYVKPAIYQSGYIGVLFRSYEWLPEHQDPGWNGSPLQGSCRDPPTHLPPWGLLVPLGLPYLCHYMRLDLCRTDVSINICPCVRVSFDLPATVDRPFNLSFFLSFDRSSVEQNKPSYRLSHPTSGAPSL